MMFNGENKNLAEGDQYDCLSDWLYSCKGNEDPSLIIERMAEVMERLIDTLSPALRRMVLVPLQSGTVKP